MGANVGKFGLRQQATGRTNCRLSSGVGSALQAHADNSRFTRSSWQSRPT